MNKTEKRPKPKLLKDWPSPFRETIPAGTIATVQSDIPRGEEFRLYGFTRPDGVGVDECLREWEMRDCPDWFAFVDVCLTCQRCHGHADKCKTCGCEVCERVYCPDKGAVSNAGLCHGHADKCETCQREACGRDHLSMNGIEIGDLCQRCHGHDEPKRDESVTSLTGTNFAPNDPPDVIHIAGHEYRRHAEPKPEDADAPTPRPELTCLDTCGGCNATYHRLLDHEVEALGHLSDDSIECPECGNSREMYSAYACCVREPTAPEPKPEPPYPVPDDVILTSSWWGLFAGYDVPQEHRAFRPSEVNNVHSGPWRTREHAEKAAAAHKQLDVVLQNAFNVAAGFASGGTYSSANHHFQHWNDRDGALSESDLLRMIHSAKRGGSE